MKLLENSIKNYSFEIIVKDVNWGFPNLAHYLPTLTNALVQNPLTDLYQNFLLVNLQQLSYQRIVNIHH
jgi:hypothetical protein